MMAPPTSVAVGRRRAPEFPIAARACAQTGVRAAEAPVSAAAENALVAEVAAVLDGAEAPAAALAGGPVVAAVAPVEPDAGPGPEPAGLAAKVLVLAPELAAEQAAVDRPAVAEPVPAQPVADAAPGEGPIEDWAGAAAGAAARKAQTVAEPVPSPPAEVRAANAAPAAEQTERGPGAAVPLAAVEPKAVQMAGALALAPPAAALAAPAAVVLSAAAPKEARTALVPALPEPVATRHDSAEAEQAHYLPAA
jgi:nicotinate-nucleotide--dimethylbenzimidazole phosphoribosyltransferase